MRAVIQRVGKAEVRVEGRVTGRIGRGLLVFVGVATGDTVESAKWLAEKTLNLRVFDDDQGRLSHSVLEAGGAILCVSQFTLMGDCRKGRRPSYDRAASPEDAKPLYDSFVEILRAQGAQVETGEFRAMMEVELVNDGPVTLLLDSEKVL